ncbi:hypothetical protein ON010_g17869 [Phytophthora cinnamomi]|nr:hypothetical protein ON010_g17869 [Phytophthora cinnamomi]
MISGTQSDRAEYYSAKHKLHGYKTEISVIPTGLAINCSHYRRESAADISFFRDNKAFHKAAATKRSQKRLKTTSEDYARSLTNVQVRAHPLRADDGENYKNYLRRLIHIGTTRLNKRREANRRTRERRLLRLAMEVPAVDEGNSSGSDDLMTQYSTAY